MSRYLDNFPEETIIKVLRAYLVCGESHRSIQKNILGLPAPARGGGFIAMDILHHYDIKGEHKGILSNNLNYEPDSDLLINAINKVNEFNSLESLANNAIINHDIASFDKASVSEIERTTKQRIGQSALRNTVLNNYANTCALCEIHQSDLLVCSHIVPWTIDSDNRLNPTNAILLCSLHDSLFDKGYFSLDDEYNLVLSNKADNVISHILTGSIFKPPAKDAPSFSFLKYHREEVCE